MRGQLFRLLDAVPGERWVAGDSGWGGDGGAVFAGFGVYDPVGSELGDWLLAWDFRLKNCGIKDLRHGGSHKLLLEPLLGFRN